MCSRKPIWNGEGRVDNSTTMDSLWALVGGDPATYFNISLVLLLQRCHHTPQTTVLAVDDNTDDAEDAGDVDFSSYVNEAISWLLGGDTTAHGDESSSTVFIWDEEDDCEDILHSSVGGSLSAVSIVKLLVCILSALFFFSFLLCLVWKRFSVRKVREQSAAAEKTTENINAAQSVNKEEIVVSDVGGAEQEKDADSGSSISQVCPKPSLPVVISLANPSSVSEELHSFVSKPDSAQFLSNTIGHLQTQLDWMLGLAADDSSVADEQASSTAASLLTPKVYRKRGMRRPRWQTMASLPLGAGSMSPDDKRAIRMWQKLEAMERKMDWKQLDVGDLDITAVEDNRLSAVLQFYQQVCPVRAEQWNAACLIVNYVLVLLEQELGFVKSDRSPLQFQKFESFGSASSQTCIARANRFDVMMVLQVPYCCEMSIYHCEVCDEIPPGKVVLGFKEAPTSTGRAPANLLHKDRVGESFGTFLSAREVVKTTQRLVSNAVERLRLRNKALLDRLSFSVQLAQFDDLRLSINTKLLNGLGLGLSEISVRLTPALQVSPPEATLLPPVFAVPPWNSTSDCSDASRSRIQSRIMRNRSQGVPSDLLWQLNCSALAKSFMASSESRLLWAGVSGCQVMCQQLLHALFSRSGKDTLLATGEVSPHVLDSVVYFLLLESPASSWSLSCLPDRLSDCIHFLRSAVQSAWMPSFMIHNPHLVKQMPALKLLPLVTPSRQENILAGVGLEASDSILSFMDHRLQETGLRRCLKSDYSTEMWEYEFFIFGWRLD